MLQAPWFAFPNFLTIEASHITDNLPDQKYTTNLLSHPRGLQTPELQGAGLSAQATTRVVFSYWTNK